MAKSRKKPVETCVCANCTYMRLKMIKEPVHIFGDFCTDGKYEHVCGYNTIDIVTGSRHSKDSPKCRDERASGGPCGPKGKLYKVKTGGEM